MVKGSRDVGPPLKQSGMLGLGLGLVSLVPIYISKCLYTGLALCMPCTGWLYTGLEKNSIVILCCTTSGLLMTMMH